MSKTFSINVTVEVWEDIDDATLEEYIRTELYRSPLQMNILSVDVEEDQKEDD